MSDADRDAPSGPNGTSSTPITLRVDYRRRNTFFADYAKNISKGGTFIRTTRPLTVGTEFIFVLSVPGSPSTNGDTEARTIELKFHGVVRSVIREADATTAQPAGMAIEFLYQSDAERRLIEETVAELMRDSLGPMLAAKLLGQSPTPSTARA